MAAAAWLLKLLPNVNITQNFSVETELFLGTFCCTTLYLPWNRREFFGQSTFCRQYI